MFRFAILVGSINLVLLVFLLLERGNAVPASDVITAITVVLAVAAVAAAALLILHARRADGELREHREAELRFGALFDHSPICMNIKDTDGRYVMINRAYCDWYGKPASEIVGQMGSSVMYGAAGNVTAISDLEAQVAESGRAASLQVEVEREGKRHQRLLVKFPALDDTGAVIGLGTIALDVTEQKEAEAALTAERARASRLEAILREAIMVMPAAFAVFDESDKLVLCNREYVSFIPSFRNNPDLAIGVSFRQIVKEVFENGMARSVGPEEGDDYIEERLRIHQEASGLPHEQLLGDRICLTYETRMPQGGIIVLRQDVTEQRRLEREHHEAEDLLRNLFDNFTHGIMIRDRETRLVRANQAALDQIGLTAEQVSGRTTAEMFEMLGIEDFTGDVTAQERDLMAARKRDDALISRTGPDGAMDHMLISRFPIVDRNDTVQGLGVLRYDVTELIEAQRQLESAKEDLEKTVLARTEELRASEQRFRVLAQVSADFFWECDRDLYFTNFSDNFPNPLGGDPSELVGMSIPDYYDLVEEDESIRRTLLDAYGRRESVKDFEIARRYRDGKRYFRLNATPRWENGEFLGYVGTTTDISELYAARESLVEAERLASLGSMVAGIAHEINTPIGICVTAGTTVSSAVDGLMAGLSRGNLKKSEFEAALTRIVEGMKLVDTNLARAAKLISSFKSIAVDQTSEEERTFNLVGYLQDVMDSLSPQLRREGVAVSISGPDDILLRSYPGAIAQILTNLVMNSIAHGFAGMNGGKISVSVTRAGGYLEFVYMDDGQGMTEETVRRVFDPFFTTKRGQGGSGLGMHILFNLVTQILKGTVRCDSAPGDGVKISIRFPMVEAGA